MKGGQKATQAESPSQYALYSRAPSSGSRVVGWLLDSMNQEDERSQVHSCLLGGMSAFETSVCGGLDENVSHRLKYLNSWFPGARTVWEGLGGMALLEEACHWVWVLRFQKPVIPS